MSENRTEHNRSRVSSRKLLIALLVILVIAALALVLIIIDKSGKNIKPGPVNPGETSSPGAQVTLPPDSPEGLIINEVMRGDRGFAELVNNSRKEIDLAGYCLSDNPEKADKWQFPSYKLQPGEYAVVELTGGVDTARSGETGSVDISLGGEATPAPAPETVDCARFIASFKLNSSENGVYLFARSGSMADRLVFDNAMPDGIAAVRFGTGCAYTAFPTKGAENSADVFTDLTVSPMDGSDPVRISEVLPSNKYNITDEDGDRSDWAELYNGGPSAVSLAGYYLSDDSLNPAKWALPDITLGSGEYLLVFLSGKDRRDGELHASFKLSSTDAGLFFTNFNGLRQDVITVPEGLSDNVSIGRGEDGSLLYYARPTPGERNSSAGFTDYMGVGGFNPSSVYISEACSVTAPRSHQMDWVELYNPTAETVSLAGWHLSDSVTDLEKYEFPAVSIPADGYTAVNCSASILDSWADPAPFNLSPAGETVYLTDAEGQLVDCFETGTLRNGVTSGRENGTQNGERVFFTAPTKGARNSDTCLLAYAAAPVFSEAALYHTSAFTVELTTRSADGTIHYTLDGSKPSAESPVYEGPLSVSGNTVLRAITCVPGRVDSDVASATYLFEQPHTIPVVTLAMAPGDFAEMYAVSRPFVPVVERECMLQYFETDGTLGVESPAGVRVSGASTRAYAQKSLGLYFRAGYGRSKLTYPFFGSDYITTFGGLVLRNAGQDWSNARIRDSFTSTAVLDMDVDASAAKFVAVYINGQYWGLYDLKENMNEDYLEAHYGIDPDTVNMIQRNNGELKGTNADFLRVRGYAVQNGTVIPMTDERYRQFTQWVDPESFADYLIGRQYFPDADLFNQKYWRTNDYKIRWRAIFYDSDFALTSSQGDVLHCYFDVSGTPSANGSLTYFDIQCGLRSNEKWTHDFLVRYIYVTKYYLNNDRLLPLLDSMVSTITPEMNRQIARWQHPQSYSHWQSEVQKLRTNLIERPALSKQNLLYVMRISSAEYDALEQEADALFASHGGVFTNYDFD